MDRWSVITKIPSMSQVDESQIAVQVRHAVRRSLDRLKVNRVHAVLVHDPQDLVGERGSRLFDQLRALREEGVVTKIGASVYSPVEVIGLVGDASSVVQAPINIFDQRFIRAASGGVLSNFTGELHARSLFLQGLLLMSSSERPQYFLEWQDLLWKVEEEAARLGISTLALCLGFAARQASVRHCVVGVESSMQITEIVNALELAQRVGSEAEEFVYEDPRLIDPRIWL